MSNLLLNPNNWTDDNGHSPPACWNGSAYVASYSGFNSLTLTLNASVVVGADDYIEAMVSGPAGSNSGTAVITYGSYSEVWDCYDSAATRAVLRLPAGARGVEVSMDARGSSIAVISLRPTADALPAVRRSLLSNPSDWTDDSNNCPPACWNGTAYEAVNQSTYLYYNDPASISEGDVIEATASCLLDSGIDVSYGNFRKRLTVPTSPALLSILVWPTANLSVGVHPGYGCSSDTVTLIPTKIVVPVFWTDFAGCREIA